MRAVLSKVLYAVRTISPAPLVPLIVMLRSRVAWLRVGVRTDAYEQMRFVVGDTPSDAEVWRLAKAYVRRSIWRGEARFHPELVNRQSVTGLEPLRRLQEQQRAFIVNSAHHGDYEAVSASLTHAGVKSRGVATHLMFEPGAPLWMKMTLRVASSHGITPVNVSEGSASIRKVLDTGHPVTLLIDQPGHTMVNFLGHDLQLSAGAARLAMEANVPVVVATAHPDPSHPHACARLHLSEPIEPADFGSVQELVDELMRRHEKALLAWPEAAEHPRRMLDRSLVRSPLPPTGGQAAFMKPNGE